MSFYQDSSKSKKIFVSIAAGAALLMPLAACGSSSDSSSASSTKTTVAKPLARLNDLSTGGTTGIALDSPSPWFTPNR